MVGTRGVRWVGKGEIWMGWRVEYGKWIIKWLRIYGNG